MQRLLKRVASFGLALLMCLGITAIANGVSSETITVDAMTVSEYYEPITATSGKQLFGQVHDLITKTHKYYSSYNDCRDYGPVTDPDLEGRGGIVEFYTHETIMTFKGDAGTWNREHVWAQSLSKDPSGKQMWGTDGAGSDLHHIRPSEARINGARGNDKFGEVTNGTAQWSKTTSGANSKIGGYSKNGTFMPLPDVKGDVARIILYVYTHYNSYNNSIFGNYATTNGNGSSGYFGTLNLTQIVSASSESAAISLLLDWNKSDEVDPIERTRNEETYKLQGNRNPFIDHPEYADAIWGGGSVTPNPGGDTSNKLTDLTISPSALNLTVGKSQTLTVTATPSTASNSVTWSSSNTAVATVSNGTVTAIGEGTAKITATSTVNTDIKKTINVTVTKSSSPTPGQGSSITINIGSFPTKSGYSVHNWSEGGVSGVAYMYGSTSRMQFNSNQSSHYLASTTAMPGPITSIEVKLEKDNKKWRLYTSTSAYSTVKDGNPTSGTKHDEQNVTSGGTTWQVSGKDTYFSLVYEDEGVCYIDSITVTYASGGSVDTPVTPDPSVTLQSLTMNHTSIDFAVGDKIKLSAQANPSNADASVTWQSSDSSVATVSSDGMVTAVSTGTATVTATSTVNPQIKATCQITVKAAETVTPPAGETPPGPGDYTPDVSGFHDAVEAIALYSTLSGRFAAITTAISLYNTLNNAGTALNSGDIATLKAAIDKYNADINSYNQAAEGVDKSTLHPFLR